MSRHSDLMIARARLRWLGEVRQMSAIGTQEAYSRAGRGSAYWGCAEAYVRCVEPPPMTQSGRRASRTKPWLQPLLTARTSGKRCTSPMKRASKGEVLSRLHARVSLRGRFKSTTGKMATVSGHRQRALPRTHPTPKPVDTRLKIVASFSPSWTMRGDFKPPR
jgi:hypothetical protein